MSSDVVTCSEVIRREPAEQLCDLTDTRCTDLVPFLAHWVYLLDHPPLRSLGNDGHPRDGLAAPPGPGWRRMSASGVVEIETPLRFGETAIRRSRRVSSVRKAGRSGTLVFVTIHHEIVQGGRRVLQDEQRLVFREPRAVPGPPPESADGATKGRRVETPTKGRQVETPTTMLFRYSALTANAHRVHYDLGFAHAEGYADLLVQGPLQAWIMADELRRQRGVDVDTGRFEFQFVSPLVASNSLVVTAAHDAEDGTWRSEVRTANGRTTAVGRLSA